MDGTSTDDEYQQFIRPHGALFADMGISRIISSCYQQLPATRRHCISPSALDTVLIRVAPVVSCQSYFTYNKSKIVLRPLLPGQPGRAGTSTSAYIWQSTSKPVL